MNGCLNMPNERVLTQSVAVIERGQGVRFDLPEYGDRTTGFVVRFDGQVYAYVNQCAHVPVELDWSEGDFFDLDKQYLICATHGAHYQPKNGYCVMGPCKGRSLKRLQVVERDGNIYLLQPDIDVSSH
jgi:nitrite reductase/ring-hydroxylating ferredoxin subunit